MLNTAPYSAICLIKMAHYDVHLSILALRDVCVLDSQRRGKLQVFPDGNYIHKDFSMSLSSGRDFCLFLRHAEVLLTD